MADISRLLKDIITGLHLQMSRLEDDLADNRMTKDEVDNMQRENWTVLLVDSLPATGTQLHLYLVPGTGPNTDHGTMEEYIWLVTKNKFEKIGQINYDMRNYFTIEELDELLDGKMDITTFIPSLHSDITNDSDFIETVIDEGLKQTYYKYNAQNLLLGLVDSVRLVEMVDYWTKEETVEKPKIETGVENNTTQVQAVDTSVKDGGEVYGLWFEQYRDGVYDGSWPDSVFGS